MLRICVSALLVLITLAPAIAGEQKHILLPAGRGQPPFDVTSHAVPIEEIVGGGPPRDGVPALDQLRFVEATEARKFLRDEDKVLGVTYNGVAKAYPAKILNWHEVVNDDFAGKPVAVTW